ncbi:MAG: tetratricopeptide repeat protein [Planctomycetes bacterium]|nr:tetratricopeptide repeat protein [Planctomycetota bacterium]
MSHRAWIVPLAFSAVAIASGCGREAAGPGPASQGAAAGLEAAGRWAEAAAAHRAAALAAGPERGDESARKAMAAYVMANRAEDAERFAAECLERDPRYHEVLFYLGDAQRVMMRHEAARATLERLLALEPGHRKGAFALAHVLARLGKHAEAAPLLERLLADEALAAEQRSFAAIELARSLKRLGRPREAADRLAQILEAEPFNAVALSEAAQVFLLLGKGDLAKALRAEHAWLFERGHLLSTEDASKEYRTGPGEADEARLALQAADRREVLRATGALEDLVARRPGDVTVRTALARLWLRLHRYGDVLRVAGSGPPAARAWPDLLAVEAEALASLGSAEAGNAWLEASRRAGGEAAARELGVDRVLEIHLGAGRALLEEEAGLPAAEECFARAERIAPGDWRPPCGAGRLHIARGEAARALELFAESRRRAGGEGSGPAELRRWTATARGLQGDLRFAAREIMDLVRSGPGDLESFEAFERVFGSRAEEPEVARVLEMKRALEEKLAERDRLARAFSEKPLRDSAPECLALANLLLAQGPRETALELFFLAAELDPGGAEALRLAAGALAAPREAFQRLNVLRRLLGAAPGDPWVLERLVRAYLELDLRLDEAERLAGVLAASTPAGEGERLLGEVRARRGR